MAEKKNPNAVSPKLGRGQSLQGRTGRKVPELRLADSSLTIRLQTFQKGEKGHGAKETKLVMTEQRSLGTGERKGRQRHPCASH